NFGDGHINAFNPHSGRFVGELKDPSGQPIAITHLWALAFGNGGAAGPTNTLYFTAGLTSNLQGIPPFHGLFGSLPVATDHEGDNDDGDKHSPDDHPLIMSAWIMSSPTMPSPTMPASTIPTSTMSSPNGMPEQPIDANFQESDAVSLSVDSNLPARHP